MPYQQNIPLATDELSTSQGDIQGNFQAIKTLIDVNHVTFNAVDEGKHNLVTFPDNTGPHATGATEINLNNQQYQPAVGGPLYQEIFITRDRGGAQNYPLTAGININDIGYTILPSGILMKWGRVVVGVTSVGTHTVSFPTNGNIPPFTSAPTYVQVSAITLNVTKGFAIWDPNGTLSATQFTVYASAGTGGLPLFIGFIAFGPA